MDCIAVDARLTYYRTGGISTYIRYLLAALAETDSSRPITVLHSRKTRERLVPRLRHYPLWTPSHHRLERAALSVELAPLRLDVLHSPDFIPPQRGARHHVITVHDLAFLIYPAYMTDASRRYYNDQIQWAVDHADHILAVSEATKRDLMDRLYVPETKITVQHHGVAPRFRPLTPQETAPWRERFNLPERFLLFVGTLEPRKNLSGLLDAYAILRDTLPEAPPLILAGNAGWLVDELIARVQSAPGVYWLADVDHTALPALYTLAEALILPAHYEGFGLPPLEAMACGTLPIVSERASLPEVVGDVGLRVDPDSPESIADAMQRALNADSNWREAQRQAGLDRAATFTWARSAAIARQVYREVL